MKIKKNNLNFRIKSNKKPNKKYNKTLNKKNNKRRVRGGYNSIKKYKDNDTGIEKIIDSASKVETLFNPQNNFDNPTRIAYWKTPTPVRSIAAFAYEYEPYNSLSFNFPIYFKDLPKQIPEIGGYVPIYVYKYEQGANQYKIPQNVLSIYEYIINTLFNDEWEICLAKSQVCPWSAGLKSHAHRGCCGFNAPAIGAMIYAYNYYYSVNSADIPMTDEYKELAINVGLNFYAALTGYGDTGLQSPVGWNRYCNSEGYFIERIEEGVNIVTLFSRGSSPVTRDSDCMTWHHFLIYKVIDYCIIIDSWAGYGGVRGEWARIMKTSELTTVLSTLYTTSSLEETNQLLNTYFIVPHGITQDNNIDNNLQTKLLTIGVISLSNLQAHHPAMRKSFEHLENISRKKSFLPYGGLKK